MADLIVRPIKPEEYADVCDFVARIFAEGDPRRYEAILHNFMANRPHKPGFDYRNFRAGMLGERIAAHTLVEPYTLQYGQAHLRVGGIAAVCADPRYRQRGYASAVMHDALTYSAEEGYHLALLHGIEHYYVRFGFNVVWPRYSMTINTAAAAELNSSLVLRPATANDLPQIAALYNKHWGGRVTFLRSPQMWVWRIMTEVDPVVVVEGGNGKIAGYMRGYQDTYPHSEVVADSLEAAAALLAEAGRFHHQQEAESFRWLMPPDDVMVAYARRLLPVTLNAYYRPAGGWMARLIDTSGLVDELLPELIAQARGTYPELDEYNLIFQVQANAVQIGIRNEKATLCELNHRDFIQVLFGSLRPSALAAQMHLSAESVRLLDALFPPRMAALGGWDWF